MKPICLFSVLMLMIFLNYSCSKSKTDTPVLPVIKPDTLTAGWTKTAVSSNGIVDIFFSSNTAGYALSADLLKTTDGGLTWLKIPASYGNAVNLAVTGDGKIFVASTPNTIFRSANGGSSFSSTTFSSPGIFDVYFTDNNTGYTVTTTGLFQTTDGGLTWPAVSPVTGLTISGSGSGYNTLFFLNNTTGWIANGNTVFKSNGNVNNWVTASFSPLPPQNGSLSIYAPSSSIVYVGSIEGKIFKSVNGGANFTEIYNFPQNSIGYLDLHFIDATTGYACYGNRIYKTVNGGSSWIPVVSLGETTFVEIHFTDASHGWGCANDGSILRFN